MAQLIEAKRATVIADAALEAVLVEAFLRLGAKGYTCMQCTGKGRHDTVESPFSGNSRVRIEVLANATVANSILAYVHHERFASYPIAAFLDTVEIDQHDSFC
jgi:hypothetical protein